MITQLIFYTFSAILLFSGLMVLIGRNSVRSALFLVLAFFAATGLWLLIEAEFLALVLVLVYVGAVMTLFLFVVMTLNLDVEASQEGFVRYLPYGIIIMALIAAMMIYVLMPEHTSSWQTIPAAKSADYSNVKELGNVLYTQYAYAFEVAGALLLVAIIAAISLAFRGSRNRKTQDISKQLAANPKDRVKLIK